MAKLHFYYGTMGSSKSAQLIINTYNFNNNGIQAEVIKPAYDTRFATSQVVSRIGISTPAKCFNNLAEYAPQKKTKVVFVDEVQFFQPTDIDKLVRIADDTNITVICYGLMTDSNQHMFPAAQHLIEVGAELHRMESNCQIRGCMNLATHHLRFDQDGKVIRSGPQNELGDSNYKSVCRQHYNLLYHNIKSRNKGGR